MQKRRQRPRQNAKMEEFTPKEEQEEVTVRDLIRTDISNMLDGEYKAIIVRILSGLRKSMEGSRETFTAKIKELKK